MRTLLDAAGEAFAPGWPERAAHIVAVALLALAALLVAFALADAGSVAGRWRAMRRGWAAAAAATAMVARHGEELVVATSTEQTALRLLKTVMGEQ